MSAGPTDRPDAAEVGAPGPAGPPPQRSAAYAFSQLYYYVVAVVGVGFLLGGAIAALIGLRQLVLPDPGQETREAVRAMLQGLAFAVPGAGAALWHVGQARRREGRMTTKAFWGASLYFHLVALIAFVTALSGITASLFGLVDAALPPRCFTPLPVRVQVVIGFCTSRADALRSASNGLIVVLVAGAVWWWHLRQGRRVGGPPAPSIPG